MQRFGAGVELLQELCAVTVSQRGGIFFNDYLKKQNIFQFFISPMSLLAWAGRG
jgi:hypothetical protein